MSQKIAPLIQAAIRNGNCGGLHSPEAKRQARALLAVARAAEEVAGVINECSVFCESCGYDNPLKGTDGSDRLNRALDRLAAKPRRSGG
jgi:hypothetical protein